jgi:hypothetical protein
VVPGNNADLGEWFRATLVSGKNAVVLSATEACPVALDAGARRGDHFPDPAIAQAFDPVLLIANTQSPAPLSKAIGKVAVAALAAGVLARLGQSQPLAGGHASRSSVFPKGG